MTVLDKDTFMIFGGESSGATNDVHVYHCPKGLMCMSITKDVHVYHCPKGLMCMSITKDVHPIMSIIAKKV